MSSRTSGSSSTTRMVSVTLRFDDLEWTTGRAGGSNSGSPCVVGRKTRNVVPWPGRLRTSTQPSCCLTMPYTVDNPRPVPRPNRFGGEKGSKMRVIVWVSMPQPVSETGQRDEFTLALVRMVGGLLGAESGQGSGQTQPAPGGHGVPRG